MMILCLFTARQAAQGHDTKAKTTTTKKKKRMTTMVTSLTRDEDSVVDSVGSKSVVDQ